MIDREQVKAKYQGKCAYTGTILKNDWQVDHKVPITNGGTDDFENLLPAQRIVNHYKRSLDIETFRVWLLGGLHDRLKKLPKNPYTERGIKRKTYLLEVAALFGITEDKPFCGEFYFEKEECIK